MARSEGREYLMQLPRFATAGESAMRPGLGRTRRMLEAVGKPHENYRIVHVAGTNGKGSTASMIAAILSAYGRRCGLHTSPHLLDVMERMRVDGQPAPGEWLDDVLRRHRGVFDEHEPSFFEATVVLSLLYFAEANVDWTVVEVGMGGRLDATNVVTPDLSIITHIGLDHTRWLGDTMGEIAREKAGIIKPDVPALVGDLPDEALGVVREVAAAKGAPLYCVRDEIRVIDAAFGTAPEVSFETPGASYRRLGIDLPGRHQTKNAALALRAAELLLPEGEARNTAVRDGLSNVRERSGLRARFELLSQEPPVFVDVAHNENGVEIALEMADEVRAPGGRLVVALGLMADKNLDAITDLLRAKGALVWPVAIAGDRAMRADELRDSLEGRGVSTIGDSESVGAALDWFKRSADPKDVMLTTGSHRVAGAAITYSTSRMHKTN